MATILLKYNTKYQCNISKSLIADPSVKNYRPNTNTLISIKIEYGI